MKLLLIDDDELDRQAIIRTFKRSAWDIEIVQASCATEASRNLMKMILMRFCWIIAFRTLMVYRL